MNNNTGTNMITLLSDIMLLITGEVSYSLEGIISLKKTRKLATMTLRIEKNKKLIKTLSELEMNILLVFILNFTNIQIKVIKIATSKKPIVIPALKNVVALN